MDVDRPKTDTERAQQIADIVIQKAWGKIFWYLFVPLVIGLNIRYFFFQ